MNQLLAELIARNREKLIRLAWTQTPRVVCPYVGRLKRKGLTLVLLLLEPAADIRLSSSYGVPSVAKVHKLKGGIIVRVKRTIKVKADRVPANINAFERISVAEQDVQSRSQFFP